MRDATGREWSKNPWPAPSTASDSALDKGRLKPRSREAEESGTKHGRGGALRLRVRAVTRGRSVWKKPRARRGRGGSARERMIASLATTRPQCRHVLAHRTTSAVSDNREKTAESTSSGRSVPLLSISSTRWPRRRRARASQYLLYGAQRREDRRGGGGGGIIEIANRDEGRPRMDRNIKR